jgi:hypothetical protein
VVKIFHHIKAGANQIKVTNENNKAPADTCPPNLACQPLSKASNSEALKNRKAVPIINI